MSAGWGVGVVHKVPGLRPEETTGLDPDPGRGHEEIVNSETDRRDLGDRRRRQRCDDRVVADSVSGRGGGRDVRPTEVRSLW